jgi:hypothetical protein
VSRWLDRVPDRIEDFEHPENAVDILQELLTVVLKAYGSVRQHLIVRANFMPLALVLAGLLSSLYASVEQYLLKATHFRGEAKTPIASSKELNSIGTLSMQTAEIIVEQPSICLEQIPIIPQQFNSTAAQKARRKEDRSTLKASITSLNSIDKMNIDSPKAPNDIKAIQADKTDSKPTERKRKKRKEIDDIFGFL